MASTKQNTEFWAKVNATFQLFLQKYPKTFFPKDSVETRPLRTGIFTRLTAENPEIKRAVIGEFLKNYTLKDRYLRALISCPDRVELDGSAYQPVLDKHREYALKLLTERQESRVAKKAA